MNKNISKKIVVSSMFIAVILALFTPISVKADYVTFKQWEDGEHMKNHDQWYYLSEQERLDETKDDALLKPNMINYFVIRDMALSKKGKYSQDILENKYNMMDYYLRFNAEVSDVKPDYYYEKSKIIYKDGVIDRIWKTDEGDWFFTLEDNPEKRFYLYTNNDWSYQRLVTNSGDYVHLITTVDRRVYHFDNYSLTNGINASCYEFSPHPEDVAVHGYFPSMEYCKRMNLLDKVPNKFISDFLDLVWPTGELYYEPDKGGYDFEWDYDDDHYVKSADELCHFMSMLDEANEGLSFGFSDGSRDWFAREKLHAHNVNTSDISENVDYLHMFIKDKEKLDDGGWRFTTWNSPTRWWYLPPKYAELSNIEDCKRDDNILVVFSQERKIAYLVIKHTKN